MITKAVLEKHKNLLDNPYLSVLLADLQTAWNLNQWDIVSVIGSTMPVP